jgi:hypothetical protein
MGTTDTVLMLSSLAALQYNASACPSTVLIFPPSTESFVYNRAVPLGSRAKEKRKQRRNAAPSLVRVGFGQALHIQRDGERHRLLTVVLAKELCLVAVRIFNRLYAMRPE